MSNRAVGMTRQISLANLVLRLRYRSEDEEEEEDEDDDGSSVEEEDEDEHVEEHEHHQQSSALGSNTSPALDLAPAYTQPSSGSGVQTGSNGYAVSLAQRQDTRGSTSLIRHPLHSLKRSSTTRPLSMTVVPPLV